MYDRMHDMYLCMFVYYARVCVRIHIFVFGFACTCYAHMYDRMHDRCLYAFGFHACVFAYILCMLGMHLCFNMLV